MRRYIAIVEAAQAGTGIRPLAEAARLLEARIGHEGQKFWFNAKTSKILWFGGDEHHAHSLYVNSKLFGLTNEQVASLEAHPALQDAEEDEDGEPDMGARIVYLPELFWHVMQQGWVRGGLEGRYDDDDHTILHPHGLYLEGKSLSDLARSAKFVAAQAAGDPEFPDDGTDWHVDTLRLAVRTGPDHRAETSYRLADERAEMFMKTGRIPSERAR